jgi:kinetochore protein NNF1
MLIGDGQKEFDNIMVSRQVVPKLNDLESLISDASRRRAESTTEEPTP